MIHFKLILYTTINKENKLKENILNVWQIIQDAGIKEGSVVQNVDFVLRNL